KLPDFLAHSIGGETQLNAGRIDASSISSHINAPEGSYAGQLINGDETTIYIGRNPGSPEVGDVRITFFQIPPAEVSIIAQVTGNTFKAFTASNGYTFSSLEMGRVDTAEMFKDARSSNNIMAWVLRVVGIIIVVWGLKTILAPLSVLADVIPILGTIVGAGTGFVSWVLGLAWSLIVIAVAWVRFRPLIAGCLIAAAVVLMLLPLFKGKNASA
ncbi:MAG: TMEM43 family protein, partial [Synergistaceae bacterium]|nr:TMEM43 family protein [Synergistaceae bacterium]